MIYLVAHIRDVDTSRCDCRDKVRMDGVPHTNFVVGCVYYHRVSLPRTSREEREEGLCSPINNG